MFLFDKGSEHGNRSFVVGVIVSLILAGLYAVLNGLIVLIHQVFRIAKFESSAFLSL